MPNSQRPRLVDIDTLRSVQRHSLIAIVALFVSLCSIAGYALIMDSRRADTISQLSVALTEQRTQFEDCTADTTIVAASACETPVADEPEQIIKESEDKAVTIGPQGPQGIQGTRGVQGIMGPTGPAGPSAYQVALSNGFRGSESGWIRSLQGARGVAGQNGLVGASAYQVAVEHGFTGSEVAWLSSLRGANGSQGARGEKGEKGDTGSQGVQGLQGEKGAQGDRGEKGDTGDRGPQGEKGDRGEKGEKGEPGGPTSPATMADVCPSGYHPGDVLVDGVTMYACIS